MLRHFLRGSRHLQGGGETVFTAFCLSILVSLQKDLVIVRVRLKLEVFLSSILLKNSTNFKAKVGVRLKLECGLN